MGTIAGVQQVPIGALTPYERNAKLHSPEQVRKIADSIREFGFISPCLIDREGNVIAGHGRILAAQELGMTEVPCVYVEGLTEAQRRAYILADNRLTELGEWDTELLDLELKELKEMDFDVAFTGFDVDLDLPEPVEVDDDNFDPDKEVPTRTKKGDLWILGDHRLLCGDSTVEEDCERLMGREKADMVFTDPPWNVNYGSEHNERWKLRTILNDNMTTDGFKDFMNRAFACMNAASKPGAMTYVVMSAQEWGNLMLTLLENGYHWSSTIIWHKDSLVLSRKDYHTQYEPIWYGWKDGEARLCPLKDRKQSDVWDFERPRRSDEHPTMKPVPLVARAVTNSSKPGDAILDLFGGSGTTLIACEETGRRCFMNELDPHYCDVIIDRWEEHTGEKAVLFNA